MLVLPYFLARHILCLFFLAFAFLTVFCRVNYIRKKLFVQVTGLLRFLSRVSVLISLTDSRTSAQNSPKDNRYRSMYASTCSDPNAVTVAANFLIVLCVPGDKVTEKCWSFLGQSK